MRTNFGRLFLFDRMTATKLAKMVDWREIGWVAATKLLKMSASSEIASVIETKWLKMPVWRE